MRPRLSLTLALLLLGAATGAARAGERFKLRILEAGVYGLAYEELAAAGLTAAGVPSARLGLSSRGRPAPLWVEDGGDGVFGPGDRLEFVAERLPGEVSYFNETTPYNVYWLELDAEAPWHGGEAPAAAGCPPAKARVERHLERDLLRVRFPGVADERTDEIWYWSRLTYLEGAAFELDVDLSDLALRDPEPLALTISLRGWSALPRTLQQLDDHEVEVLWNGLPVASARWDNGRGDQRIEVAELPGRALEPAANQLTVRVPKRTAAGGEALVDVVLLNWIELGYPRNTTRLAGQDQVVWQAPAAACLELPTDPAHGTRAYRTDGRRFTARAGAPLRVPQAEDPALWLVADDALRSPSAIQRDAPSEWRTTRHRADYLMIAHPSLLAAVEPLAEFHRSRGLAVALIDVEDVYDEFSDGIETPRAIREFVHHAWQDWQRPAPRFVLLVGDASWDSKNPTVVDANYADWAFGPEFKNVLEQFPKNESTPYADHPEANIRGLVPTWPTVTYQGHAASDNAFVVFGEDGAPSLAIGRLPVLRPEEVETIVSKTIAYATRPPLGPWRARSLFITNETQHHQMQSDALAADLALRGFGIVRVYPLSSETSNEHHTRRLIEAFDEGQLLVHFLGHGGRYIWRTGPPDFKKNHDLFTLDDLDRLAPTGKPAIVLSMSCYSAPFDHPNADSIGEKFLRLADKGAAAVIAASWRNAPGRDFSSHLLAELTQPGATVGEALLHAKQRVRARTFRDQYNLLGDPALPVALPSLSLAVEADDERPGVVRVAVPAADFDGQALVEWRGAGGHVLARETLAVTGAAFQTELAADPEGDVAAVGVYVWSERLGVDGFGVDDVAGPADPTQHTAGASTEAGPTPAPAPTSGGPS